MPMFRKKPVVIEAMQFTPDNRAEVMAWCGTTKDALSYREGVMGFCIPTLEDGDNSEGQHIALVGDWIIRGVKGEHYPCKPRHLREDLRARIAGAHHKLIQGNNVNKELLLEARTEILNLRRENEVLTAQMGVVEVFAAALGLKRNNSGGMAPDVAWSLMKAYDELDKAESKVTAAPIPPTA